jgi:hypothetical protein
VLVSTLCLLTLLTALISIDPRVKERFWQLVSQTSREGVTPAVERIGDAGQAIVRSANDYSLAQEPLLVFTVVAIVLVFFMLRS